MKYNMYTKFGFQILRVTGTFHEPKTIAHKVQKALMMETDVSETVNEMLMSVKKMGRCGIIAA